MTRMAELNTTNKTEDIMFCSNITGQIETEYKDEANYHIFFMPQCNIMTITYTPSDLSDSDKYKLFENELIERFKKYHKIEHLTVYFYGITIGSKSNPSFVCNIYSRYGRYNGGAAYILVNGIDQEKYEEMLTKGKSIRGMPLWTELCPVECNSAQKYLNMYFKHSCDYSYCKDSIKMQLNIMLKHEADIFDKKFGM